MGKVINIWYDSEGDYLEIILEKKEGLFVETDNESIMIKKDETGQIIGLSIMNMSRLKNSGSVDMRISGEGK